MIVLYSMCDINWAETHNFEISHDSFAGKAAKMVVSEEDVMNIMGGMEHAEGIKLNDHKRKLKNRSEPCQ